MSRTDVKAGPAPREAGPVQGMLAMLAACLPLVAAMALPPAVPRLLAHFAGTPGAAVLVPMLAAAPAACIALLAPVAGLLTSLIHDCYERFPFRFRARGMGVWAAFFFAGQFASPLMVSAVAAGVGGLRATVAILGLVPLIIAALAAALGWGAPARPAVRPA